jgi:hypothetical protein
MAASTLSYLPTEADAASFWNEARNNTRPEAEVPEGFPKALTSPLAWKPVDVEKRKSEWYLNLQQEDIEAIEGALKNFEARSENLADILSDISAETFVLPHALVERLRQVSEQCYNGIGFKVIRGLDPSKYSPVQNAAIYAGIGAHVAPQRGFVDIFFKSVIAHIVNVAGEKSPFTVKAPPGFSNSALSFHTDNCEIMGLFCLDTAVKGGTSLLSSSWNIYNELVAKRPDILHTLTEEWVLDTFKDYKLAPPRYRHPLDSAGKDHILLRFSRYGITGWQKERNPNLPAPTKSQLDAIDAVQFIAAANCIRIPLDKGDILFVNDMAVMHARDGFAEDGQYLKRHFLKMLFRDPEKNWPVPESAKTAWLKMYGPNQPDGTRKEIWDTNYTPGSEQRSHENG